MLLPCVTVPYWVILGQTVRTQLRRYARKFWPLASRHSKSLKVNETDTDRSATYDFLLAIHNNQWAYLVPFPRWTDKNRKFSHSRYLTPPLSVFHLEFCNCGVTAQALTGWRKECDDICISFDKIPEWQTDIGQICRNA